MIAIKRVCKFFDRCYFADEKSRTCTQDVGGDNCVVFGTLSRLQKGKAKGGKRIMENKVKEVQKYLEQRGIIASETAIINAAIKIATRWGGNAVFVCEFKKGEK